MAGEISRPSNIMVELEINGEIYDFPESREMDWGDIVTAWATAVTEGMLQKAGGSFHLINDVDFGGSSGILSHYYKTRTEIEIREQYLATDGQFRLANIDTIQWRNATNDANLSLGVVNDELVFNGVELSGNNYPAQLGHGGF